MKRLISILVLTTLVLSICFTGTTGFKTAFADSEVDLNDGNRHYACILANEESLLKEPSQDSESLILVSTMEGVNDLEEPQIVEESALVFSGEILEITDITGDYVKLNYYDTGFEGYIDIRKVLIDPQFVVFEKNNKFDYIKALIYPNASKYVALIEPGQKYAILGMTQGTYAVEDYFYIILITSGVGYVSDKYEHTIVGIEE